MALPPLKALQPGVVTPAAAQRLPSAHVVKDYVALVAAWMDETEASAPPPSQLSFAIHMRRQAARLVEMLGG